MMNTKYKLQLTNIERIARQFVEEQNDGRFFAFYGQMGAGKTTFIAAVCKALGIEEPVNSPTFAIVNEYVADNGETVYHRYRHRSIYVKKHGQKSRRNRRR